MPRGAFTRAISLVGSGAQNPRHDGRYINGYPYGSRVRVAAATAGGRDDGVGNVCPSPKHTEARRAQPSLRLADTGTGLLAPDVCVSGASDAPNVCSRTRWTGRLTRHAHAPCCLFLLHHLDMGWICHNTCLQLPITAVMSPNGP
jgi:hypothetical protein